MKIKRLLLHLPLVAALFLMGCSYGCDSKNKVDTDYETESPVEDEDSDDEALEEESVTEVIDEVSDEINDEINEEEPVVLPDSEDAPMEDSVDQGGEGGAEEPVDFGENYEEEADPNANYGREADPPAAHESEENFETEEEYYDDDYPQQ